MFGVTTETTFKKEVSSNQYLLSRSVQKGTQGAHSNQISIRFWLLFVLISALSLNNIYINNNRDEVLAGMFLLRVLQRMLSVTSVTNISVWLTQKRTHK